jgi:hypothetical protein
MKYFLILNHIILIWKSLDVFVLLQPYHMGEENLIREVESVFF